MSDIVVPKLEDEKEKPFIIVHTRDVKKSELKLLQKMGKVLVLEDGHINLSIDNLHKEFAFDYLLIDLRKFHKYYEDNEHSDFSVVCICCAFECSAISDHVSNLENTLTDFPTSPIPSAFRKDLLKPILNEINSCVLLCKYVINFLSSLKK